MKETCVKQTYPCLYTVPITVTVFFAVTFTISINVTVTVTVTVIVTAKGNCYYYCNCYIRHGSRVLCVVCMQRAFLSLCILELQGKGYCGF
jgi:hypothetical protein